MFKAKDIIAERYRLVLPLGDRDRGAVWRALDLDEARPVAVATVEPAEGDGAWRVQRFLEAMETVADLGHPNVVRVLDSGETDDGGAFAAMELLEGGSLAAHLSEEPTLTLEELADVAAEALEGLAALHSVGVVHGAVEPGNLFLLTGSGMAVPKLVGIAHSRIIARGGDEEAEDEGYLRSLAYTSPEQARREVDLAPASDGYCFGVVLYEALAGRMPHLGRTVEEIRVAVLTANAPALHSVRPDVPTPLARVVQRAMAREPSARYENALAMKKALAEALAAVRQEDRAARLPVGERGVHRPSQVERAAKARAEAVAKEGAKRQEEVSEPAPPKDEPAPAAAGVLPVAAAPKITARTGPASIKTTLAQWPKKALEEGAEAAAWRMAANLPPAAALAIGGTPSGAPAGADAEAGRPPEPEAAAPETGSPAKPKPAAESPAASPAAAKPKPAEPLGLDAIAAEIESWEPLGGGMGDWEPLGAEPKEAEPTPAEAEAEAEEPAAEEPEVEVEEPEAEAAEPEVEVEEPEAEAAEPDVEVAEPAAEAEEVGTSTVELTEGDLDFGEEKEPSPAETSAPPPVPVGLGGEEEPAAAEPAAAKEPAPAEAAEPAAPAKEPARAEAPEPAAAKEPAPATSTREPAAAPRPRRKQSALGVVLIVLLLLAVAAGAVALLLHLGGE